MDKLGCGTANTLLNNVPFAREPSHIRQVFLFHHIFIPRRVCQLFGSIHLLLLLETGAPRLSQ